jgi:4-diphosphocytidyl-2-C-methyl-D-erythritol kinase
MRRLALVAPAKINWSLEVLRKRADGYHEVRSVMQTIDLADTVTLAQSDTVELQVASDAAGAVDVVAEEDMAWRAATALREHLGQRRGVAIALEKRIPLAAGLGGGSSDAAAVLRGCNALWDVGLTDAELAAVGAALGSDVPFFIYGGTCVVSGRGEAVEPLDDGVAQTLLLATPPARERRGKTAEMYEALTPAMYGEGDATLGVREVIEAGRPLEDGHLANVFERVPEQMQPERGRAFDALQADGLRPHLAGSGPSFFLLADGVDDARVEERMRALGFEPLRARTLRRDAARRMIEER